MGRVNRLAKELGLTQGALSIKCGFPDPRRVQNLSGGQGVLKAEEIIELARALGVTTDRLLTGNDGLDDKAYKLIKAFNNLNETGKDAAIEVVKGLVKSFPLQAARDGESTGTGV